MLLCLCLWLHMLHAWIFVLPYFYTYTHMLRYTFPCLHAYFYAYMSRSMLSHACVLGSMFSACFMPSSMCLCTQCHVYVCHAMCYCSPFVAFVFLSCVLAKWLGSNLDPMVFITVRTPRPTSKGLDHPICMSMFACFYALYLYWPL